jgi:predicted nucleic acid-binding protein
LSEVEVASALARRARIGDCGVEERDVALATLDGDLESFLVLEIVPAVTSRARALLNAYALRAADATQLASCHHLQERLGHDVPFVVYDERLAAVARESGVTVLGADDTEPGAAAEPTRESTS